MVTHLARTQSASTGKVYLSRWRRVDNRAIRSAKADSDAPMSCKQILGSGNVTSGKGHKRSVWPTLVHRPIKQAAMDNNNEAKQTEEGTRQPRHGRFISQSLFVCTCDCSSKERKQEQRADPFKLGQTQSQSHPQSHVHREPLSQSFSIPKEQQGSGHKDKSHCAKD